MESQRNCSDAGENNQSKKITIEIEIEIEIADFPEEIIRDILSRLDVKSLLRLRCVSKPWLSLISGTQFVKAHLEFSSRNSDHGIMFNFLAFPTGFDLKQCTMSSLMLENSTVASVVDYPHRDGWVVGSCNGIICIETVGKEVCLCNPSTRKSKILPLDVEMMEGLWVGGFGYSESEDDYKVVGMFGPVVKIYSLRSDSWKRIEHHQGIQYGAVGTFASGKLHFKAYSAEMNSNYIVSLDLNSESYAIVDEPDYGDDFSDFSLGLLGGCLSILRNDQKARADVWILKDYGVKESWTRLFSVPYFKGPYRFTSSNPLLIMPSGDILFIYRSSLAVYNPKDEHIRYHPITNLGVLVAANIYIQSLVPL